MPIKIIIDKKDMKQYPDLPLCEWNSLQRELQKRKTLEGLQIAMNEVSLIQESKLKSKTWQEELKNCITTQQ